MVSFMRRFILIHQLLYMHMIGPPLINLQLIDYLMYKAVNMILNKHKYI